MTYTRNKKSKLQGGSMHEINDEYSDENVPNNNNLQGLHFRPTAFLLCKWK